MCQRCVIVVAIHYDIGVLLRLVLVAAQLDVVANATQLLVDLQRCQMWNVAQQQLAFVA